MQRYQGMWMGIAKFWGNPEVAIHEQCVEMRKTDTHRGEMLCFALKAIETRVSLAFQLPEVPE